MLTATSIENNKWYKNCYIIEGNIIIKSDRIQKFTPILTTLIKLRK